MTLRHKNEAAIPHLVVCPSNKRAAWLSMDIAKWFGALFRDTLAIRVFAEDSTNIIDFVIFVAEGRSRGAREFRALTDWVIETGVQAAMIVFGPKGRGPKAPIPHYRPESGQIYYICSQIADVVGMSHAVLRGAFDRAWPNFPEWRVDSSESERRQLVVTAVADVGRLYTPNVAVDVAGRNLRSAIVASPALAELLDFVDGERGFYSASVYLSTDRYANAIEFFMAQIFDCLGLVVVARFPAQRGSWFRKWILRLRVAMSSEEAKEIWRNLEFGLKQIAIEQQRAEIDLKLAQALEHLHNTAKDSEFASVELGSLVYRKNGKSLVVERLSPSQMIEREGRAKSIDGYKKQEAILSSQPSPPALPAGTSTAPDEEK